MKKLLETIAIPRAVGTSGNNKIIQLMKERFRRDGYAVKSMPFACKVWNAEESYIEWDDNKQLINVSPYSKGINGNGYIKYVDTLEKLEQLDQLEYEDVILFVSGELAEEQFQPKDYPFYYPDEHKRIIDLLEEKKPRAIIAVTGKHPMCGLNPFPLFDDGNFQIPSGYMSINDFMEIKDDILDKCVTINIASNCEETTSEQLCAYKRVEKSQGKIVICAHMDSKNNAVGALDNASGVVTLMKLAENLHLEDYDIDFVPFNSEEYYGANGELLYLEDMQKSADNIKLLINIDSVGHIGSKVDVSFYNISEEYTSNITKIISENKDVQLGQEWYAGDHVPFAFQGIPCIAIASSDMWEGGLDQTHTMEDTVPNVDEKLLTEAESFVRVLLEQIGIK